MTGGYQTVMFAAGTVGTIIGGALAESSGRLPYLVCAVVYAGVLGTSFRRVRGLDAQPPPAVVVPAQVPAHGPAQGSDQSPAQCPVEGASRNGVVIPAADGVAASEVVD